MASNGKRRVALIANEKGGVGKSVFTRALVDWLRTQGERVLAFDADGSIGATIRVLGTRETEGSLCKTQDPAGSSFSTLRAARTASSRAR